MREFLKQKVETIQNFHWEIYLKYRIYPETHEIKLNIFNCTREYGCEYFGAPPKLIITALTDRCYQTMFLALENIYGGSCVGPVGTGKSETIKDMSRSVA
jgi:dynein heavy chain, axonemal